MIRNREGEGAEVALREQELDDWVRGPGWYCMVCGQPKRTTAVLRIEEKTQISL